MKKTVRRLFALVLAAALLGTVAVLAAPDSTRICTLQITLADPMPQELSDATVHVELYRVADVDTNYDYTPVTAFAALTNDNVENYKNLTAAELQTLSSAAAAIAENEKPDYEDDTVAGTVGFGGLSTGLYLVLVEDLTAGENFYAFSPVLVPLPAMAAADTVVAGITILAGEDIYDVSIDTLKPQTKPGYGKLIVNKNVSTYGDPATVVFLVEAYKNDPKNGRQLVFSDILTIYITKSGTTTAQMTERIPFGTDVVVTEIYSGAGYVPVGATVQTTHLGWRIDSAGQPVLDTNSNPIFDAEATVTFTNTNDSHVRGTAVENIFTPDDSGLYDLTQKDYNPYP